MASILWPSQLSTPTNPEPGCLQAKRLLTSTTMQGALNYVESGVIERCRAIARSFAIVDVANLLRGFRFCRDAVA